MRKVLTNLLAVLAAVVAAATITAPANAAVGSDLSPQPVPNGAVRMTGDSAGIQASLRYRNYATWRILDDSYEYGLRAIPNDYGNLHQRWATNFHADGTAELRNDATGRCLDDSLDYGLRPFGCNGQSFQRWVIWFWPNDPTKGVVLQNLNTGRAVDDSFEYGLRAFGINYGTWQQW